MATRKQIAWRKKFAAMAKAGKFKKKKRITKRAKKNPRSKSKPETITRGEVVDRNTEAEIKTTKGTWVYRKWIRQFGKKPLFPWEAVQVEGGTKLERAKTKAALLKKLGEPIKRVKRNPKKNTTVKRKSVKRKKRIKRAPLKLKREDKVRKAAKGRKKSITTKQLKRRKTTVIAKNPRRRTTAKYIIRGVKPSKTGYTYYFLTPGDKFHTDRSKARKHNTRAACHVKMRSILPHLPFSISSIRCEKY